MATQIEAVLPRLGRVVGAVALLGLAFVLGAGSVASPTLAALGLGFVALLVLLARPGWAAVLAVTALPFPNLVVPGAPIEVSASDVLLVIALIGWAGEAVLRPRLHPAAAVDPPPRSVRPVLLGLAAYGTAAVVSIAAHPSAVGVVTAVQRTELVVGALVLGGGLVRAGLLRPALEGYYLTCVLLAAFARSDSSSGLILGVQKNPAGGYLATALILVVVLRPGRRWMLYAPVFAVGVVFSQSRGALLGLVVAAAVMFLVVRFGDRSRLLATFAVAGAMVYVGFLNLSAAARTRLLDTSASTDFAVRYRVDFQADAFDVFRSSPWWGTGMGNYVGGARQPGTTDPHQVLYLTLAEGGVILLVGFLVLCAVSLWVAFRLVGVSRLAVIALAVQVSTLVHALADVYWVRGTPVPAYLILGAALAVAHYVRIGDHRADEWRQPKHRGGVLGGVHPDRLPVALVAAGARRDG